MTDFLKFIWFDQKKDFIFAPAISTGALAQLVEQRTENPCVPGSIPGGTTRKPLKNYFQGFLLFKILIVFIL